MKNIELNNKLFFAIIFAGTLLRFIYGLFAQPWLHTPDQLAWQLILDEVLHTGSFSYQKLMYYPHEGGGFFIAIVSFFLKPFSGSLPSLSITALFLDTLVRYVQIRIVQKLFGSKIALWFAAWTVISIPILLAWSNVVFCLHHLASVCTFLFLFAACQSNTKLSRASLTGLVTGLSISFSYTAIIFIPVYLCFLYYITKQKRELVQSSLKFLIFTTVSILPHLFLRFIPDNGFHLEQYGFDHVREFSAKDLFSFHRLLNLLLIFIKPLPASFFLNAGTYFIPVIGRLIALFFCLFAFGSYAKRFRLLSEKELLSLFLILGFILFYALSPFFTNVSESKSFYEYRHINFILPLLILLIISSFEINLKYGTLLIINWLFICFVFSGVYFIMSPKKADPNYKVVGWILARKFGDHPETLMNLYNYADQHYQADLNYGFGWGISAALLNSKSKGDSLNLQRLKSIYYQFPKENRKLCYEGIKQSFQPGITPKLDSALLVDFNTMIDGN